MKLISLSRGKQALVDDDDFEELNKHKWCYDMGYASRRKSKDEAPDKARVFMHRVILNTPVGMDTDHKNGNKLDNRRANLRVCTSSQNQSNRGKTKANTSGFKGVYFLKRISKFQAQIAKNKKQIYLGVFTTAHEAAVAYNNAAMKLFGEFAKTK